MEVDIDDTYTINKKGVVKNKIKNYVLKHSITNSGYVTVSLHRNSVKLHRLLALHFIPNPNEYCCINHIDGDKKNNSLINLEWCNHSQNNKHAYKIGLNKGNEGYKIEGVNHGRSNFSEKDIIDIRKSNLSQKEIAFQYNCHPSIIQRIVTYKTYKNILPDM